MKTAVEWLVETLELSNTSKQYQAEIEQAKEMFEQQIKDAYQTSHISMMTADQYYNEKFS
jgi:hypothetical protein